MRVFVAGGTGFVGGHLVDRLLSEGHSVRLLTHSGRVLGRKVETVAGDAADLDTYADALHGCDAVINLVGIIREFPGRGITFRRLHV
ncbi:MAG TPA: NAD-dependent epimerase/dehydratase family protein, partial [Verrucomicrobiae bacterium]|nr:NAD-dependent epimerase/dehydratase family protein [Verrucomicrobiae bacterium]